MRPSLSWDRVLSTRALRSTEPVALCSSEADAQGDEDDGYSARCEQPRMARRPVTSREGSIGIFWDIDRV